MTRPPHDDEHAPPATGWSRTCWTVWGITTASALTSLGFSIAALTGPGAPDEYALYAASRSVALAAMVLVVAAMRSRSGLLLATLAMTLVQGFDAYVGTTTGEVAKIAGPAMLALLTLAGGIAVVREDREATPPATAHPGP